MAAIEVNVSIADAEAKKSVISCWLPDTTALADAIDFAQAFAGAIDNMITGIVTKIGLVYGVDLPAGLDATAASGSDVEDGAMFIFSTAGGYLTRIRIPTFDEAKIIGTSDAVDLTDGQVSAFRTLMLDGDGTTEPSDNRGDDITALRSAKEAHQKQRR